MKHYDDIVVGAGISGMTLAVILAANGKRVLLIEKAPHIGGSLSRFYKNGVPFDTGFHFTGGFGRGGILCDMLAVLGIDEAIKPVYLTCEKANRFVFEKEAMEFFMPLGVENTIQRLKLYFPACAVGIDEYFSLIAKVCDKTFSMDLRKISLTPDVMDEDFVSLKSVLDRLFSDDLLKGLLAIYCSCHGTRPSQVSFANHARVVYSMYQSVARVKDGGNAFIGVFKDKFKALGVDVQCGRHIVECADIKDDLVGTFILDDSSRISAQHCLFTIHPKAVLKILPRKHLSKAFVDRVSEFEASCGFFSVFGTLEGPVPVSHVDPSITSLFPSADVDEMLDPAYRGQPALVVMTDKETLAGADRRLVNAFAVSFWEHVKDWEASRLGDRPKEYLEYKKAATEDIRRRMYQACPYFEGSFKLLDSASMLTFRDYLNTPDGSAYGIKQKIGQFNLFGKLPLRNLYACGQSAVLPGLVGAMMSSFVVARALIGKEEYSRFIEDRLCRQNA